MYRVDATDRVAFGVLDRQGRWGAIHNQLDRRQHPRTRFPNNLSKGAELDCQFANTTSSP